MSTFTPQSGEPFRWSLVACERARSRGRRVGIGVTSDREGRVGIWIRVREVRVSSTSTRRVERRARAVGAADERERTGEAPGGDPGLEPDRSVRSRADAPSQPGCTPDWSTCPRRRDPLFRNDARAGARARRPPTGASANGGGGRATRRCRVGRATRARLARGRLSTPKDALLRFVPRGGYVPRDSETSDCLPSLALWRVHVVSRGPALVESNLAGLAKARPKYFLARRADAGHISR